MIWIYSILIMVEIFKIIYFKRKNVYNGCKKIMVCEVVLIYNIVLKYVIEKNFLYFIIYNIFIENW